MYRIQVPETKGFTKANGTRFRKIKLDDEGLAVKILDKEGNPIIRQGPGGQPVFEVENEIAGYLDVLGGGLDRIMGFANDKERRAIRAKEKQQELPMMGMEDSSFILDIWRAIHTSKGGKLELENHPCEWLKRNVEHYGVALYDVDAAVILEPIKKAEEVDQTRAESRREKK